MQSPADDTQTTALETALPSPFKEERRRHHISAVLQRHGRGGTDTGPAVERTDMKAV